MYSPEDGGRPAHTRAAGADRTFTNDLIAAIEDVWLRTRTGNLNYCPQPLRFTPLML